MRQVFCFKVGFQTFCQAQIVLKINGYLVIDLCRKTAAVL